MARNKVEISGINTKDIKVLTNDEIRDLIIRKNNGDESAIDILVMGNLRLVLSIVQQFANRVQNMDDIFQTGCMGLKKAIDNFDLAYNVKFSTYAVPMIKGEIKRYLRDNTSIRISRSLKDIYNKCREYQEEYFKDYGRLPGYEIIAEHLGVSTYDVVQAMESSKDPISMYEVIYNDGGDAIYVCDQIEDTKTNAKDLETRMTVDDALNKLDPREQFIIDERFVVGKTQMEVAEELMISQAQVSRLEHGAIKQLRKILR